jgi:hypothetical protein
MRFGRGQGATFATVGLKGKALMGFWGNALDRGTKFARIWGQRPDFRRFFGSKIYIFFYVMFYIFQIHDKI